MFDQQPTIELLFEQLGLDADADAIEQFIESHQLDQDTAFITRHFGRRTNAILLSAIGRKMMIGHWWSII